jgi:acetylornithine deacetylase/succinyl-diaminopimelate desuccinylase-like protein
MDRTEAMEWARDELVKMIEIRSYSDEEHELMGYLENRARQLDIPVRTQPVEGSANNLLLGWCEQPDVLLTAHTDTIIPTWEWSGRAEVRGDVVFGLGAQDDKGCAVACILGLLLARANGVPVESLPVGVGLCVDEEVGGKGSLAMARWLHPRLVVASEGTELSVATAESGFVYAWIHVPGVAVHGSLADEGVNAIERAARLIIDIGELPFAKHKHPIAGQSLASVRTIHGGSTLNAVPDRASFRLNVRVGPGLSTEEVIRQLMEAAKPYEAAVEVEETSEAFETATDAPLVATLRRASALVLGREAGITRMTAWTDAHNFVEISRSEAVIYGPGHLRQAHRPDERINIGEVVDCARVYEAFLTEAKSLIS